MSVECSHLCPQQQVNNMFHSFLRKIVRNQPSGRVQIYSRGDEVIPSSMWRCWRPGCGERPLQEMGISGVSAAMGSCPGGRTKDRGTWRRQLLSGQQQPWWGTLCIYSSLEVFVSICGAVHSSGPAVSESVVSLHRVQLPAW